MKAINRKWILRQVKSGIFLPLYLSRMCHVLTTTQNTCAPLIDTTPFFFCSDRLPLPAPF